MMATQAGLILGTAAYMSPEQAKGFPADHRSDVFSFGTVLFEMLTGRQPFQGDTAPDVLASVLVRDPDLESLPPHLNPRLHDLLRRCLEKTPKRRGRPSAMCAPRSKRSPPTRTASRPCSRRRAVAAALAAGHSDRGHRHRRRRAHRLRLWTATRATAPSVARFTLTLPEGQRSPTAAHDRHLGRWDTDRLRGQPAAVPPADFRLEGQPSPGPTARAECLIPPFRRMGVFWSSGPPPIKQSRNRCHWRRAHPLCPAERPSASAGLTSS